MPRPNGEEVAMRHLSATDAKPRLAALIDAAQCEPVVIRRQERAVAGLLWTAEDERNRGLNVTEVQEFCDRVGRKAVARGLTEKKLAALLTDDDAARAPADRR